MYFPESGRGSPCILSLNPNPEETTGILREVLNFPQIRARIIKLLPQLPHGFKLAYTACIGTRTSIYVSDRRGRKETHAPAGAGRVLTVIEELGQNFDSTSPVTRREKDEVRFSAEADSFCYLRVQRAAHPPGI